MRKCFLSELIDPAHNTATHGEEAICDSECSSNLISVPGFINTWEKRRDLLQLLLSKGERGAPANWFSKLPAGLMKTNKLIRENRPPDGKATNFPRTFINTSLILLNYAGRGECKIQ